MDRALVALVRHRAGGRCEYCRFPRPPFHIEHIIAQKHGGPTVESNLAPACVRCNFHKGPNLSGIDPENEQIVHDRARRRWRIVRRASSPSIRVTRPASMSAIRCSITRIQAASRSADSAHADACADSACDLSFPEGIIPNNLSAQGKDFDALQTPNAACACRGELRSRRETASGVRVSID